MSRKRCCQGEKYITLGRWSKNGGGGDKNLIYPLFFKITIIRKSNPSSLQVNTFLPHPQQHKSDYLLPFQDFTSQQQQQQQPSQPFNPFNFGGTSCFSFHDNIKCVQIQTTCSVFHFLIINIMLQIWRACNHKAVQSNKFYPRFTATAAS